MKESELCELLKTEAEQFGFRYFPEYEDWDGVLVRKNVVIGIQAKLKMNAKALSQTLKAGGVHLKVILTNDYKLTLNDDWNVILDALRILHISYNNGMFHIINNINPYKYGWLFKYKRRVKKVLRIPSFDYYTPSGVPGPRKVTERNINLVRLELLALQHGGTITLADARRYGLERIPRYYYEYDWKKKQWCLKPSPMRASIDYPHIAAGISGK
jgi:hypothetical protein